MAKNILVISCDIRETRAALIESGIIAELHIERKGRQSSTVGNVYLGKITRVLPGLQAAFIDIGQERAAFLHVEDLIRPDDFDDYLAGGRKLARAKDGERPPLADEEESEPIEEDDPHQVASEVVEAVEAAEALGLPPPSDIALVPSESPPPMPARPENDLEATVSYPNWPHPPPRSRSAPPSVSTDSSAVLLPEPAPSDQDVVSVETTEASDVLRDEREDVALESNPHSVNSAPTLDELPGEGEEDEEGDEDEDDDTDESQQVLPEAGSEPVVAAAANDDDDDLGDMPGFTVTEPGEPVPRAPAPARTESRGPGGGDRGGRRRRGRGRGGPGDRPDARGGAPAGGGAAERGGSARGGQGGSRGRSGGRGGDDRRGSRGSDRSSGGGHAPGRISKTTPIRDVVKEGQDILVQVTKDPIGTKGARCSSHISLPGRYVVYLPTVDHIGISKRIGSDKERARLRETIDAMKPPSGGLIVRTLAEGLTKKQLKADVGYLVRLWGEIASKREGAKSPDILSSELDLVLKVARDLFTDEVDEVIIDDKAQYDRLCRFVEMFAPDRVKDVKFYTDDAPIFDEFGIEDEIGRALSRKVPLPSGGHLIIDQAEALTAIDVNTGRFVGKGSKDMEETILQTNMEAVKEIAYQLRFRNIGGLIILDLIDMEKHSNREKVRRTLEELLQNDKAKTTLNRISDLGLIEMTRKRTRESLGRLMHEPCFYCDGTGQLQSKETIAFEILREIRRKHATLAGYSVVVNVHPAVADVLGSTEKAAVQDAENRWMRKIIVVPRKEYHLEQFDLVGK